MFALLHIITTSRYDAVAHLTSDLSLISDEFPVLPTLFFRLSIALILQETFSCSSVAHSSIFLHSTTILVVFLALTLLVRLAKTNSRILSLCVRLTLLQAQCVYASPLK